MTASILTQEELKRQLHYDPDTGIFTRLVSNNNSTKKNDIAGCNKDGYIRIMVLGKRYRAHKLAWLYIYGTLPNYIDHIDNVKNNNAISNLRIANHSQNMRNRTKTKNNKSGYKGVHYYPRLNKWNAAIGFEGKNYNLGYFDTPELASQAYKSFAQQHHGEFYRE